MCKFITLSDVFNICIKKIKEGCSIKYFDSICLYANRELCSQPTYKLNDICVISDNTSLDDNGVEYLPTEIVEVGLALYCYGSDLYDVLTGILNQIPDATHEQILMALNFFASNDAFISLPQEARRCKAQTPNFDIGIFPGFSKSDMLTEIAQRQPKFLENGRLLSYPTGSVLIGIGRVHPCITLCNLISFNSIWALHISFQESGWSHLLYQRGSPDSPIRNPKDPAVRNRYRLIPNMSSLLTAFPASQPPILQRYLRCDADIKFHQAQWESRQRKKFTSPVDKIPPDIFVLPNDRYSSANSRQAFDFLRYLSFPVESQVSDLL